jgi:hypothetical protein
MTNQEIKDTISDLQDGLNSKFTPESFKPKMEAKIKELQAKLSSTEKTKSSEKEKLAKEIVKSNEAYRKKYPENITEKLKRMEEAPKKSVPQPKPKEEKYPEDEDDYCAKVIAQAKERRRKAKENANKPQKTPATKNKEKLEKVFDNVKERAENESITKAELEKLIRETEVLLGMLKKKLEQI